MAFRGRLNGPRRSEESCQASGGAGSACPAGSWRYATQAHHAPRSKRTAAASDVYSFGPRLSQRSWRGMCRLTGHSLLPIFNQLTVIVGPIFGRGWPSHRTTTVLDPAHPKKAKIGGENRKNAVAF